MNYKERTTTQPVKKPASDGPTPKKMNSKQRRDKLRRAHTQEQISSDHASTWSNRTVKSVLDATERAELRQEFITLESIPLPPQFRQRMGPGTIIPTRRPFILARMDDLSDELAPPPDPDLSDELAPPPDPDLSDELAPPPDPDLSDEPAP